MSAGLPGPRGYKGPRGLQGATGYGQCGSETGPTGPRGGIGSFTSQVNVTAANTTVDLYMANVSTFYNVSTTNTITLSNADVNTTGSFFVFTNQTTGTCSFSTSSPMTINGLTSYSIPIGKSIMLVYKSTNFIATYPYSGVTSTGTVENEVL
jgi:hypothetical protein